MQSNAPRSATSPRFRRKRSMVLSVAYATASSLTEETGGFDDILHSLLEPILKDVNDNLKLETRGYDVVKKREYPSLECVADSAKRARALWRYADACRSSTASSFRAVVRQRAHPTRQNADRTASRGRRL
jgi:hypothetical protein